MSAFDSSVEAIEGEVNLDALDTHALISIALMNPEEDEAWDAVRCLHHRGTKEVFDAAASLCASDCTLERGWGATILGQLGVPERTFPDQSVELLLSLLHRELDPDVLHAICCALRHIHDPKAIPFIVRLRSHESENVRFALVQALSGHEDSLAIETLIALSSDADAGVRDWATFGLGSQIEVDSPAIRQALFLRLDDSDDVVRGEALVGLAVRKDARIVEPLIRELADWQPMPSWQSDLRLEAAEELGDPRLLPTLMSMRQRTNENAEMLDKAIERCAGSSATGFPDATDDHGLISSQ